jgi:hypothetical protein
MVEYIHAGLCAALTLGIVIFEESTNIIPEALVLSHNDAMKYV